MSARDAIGWGALGAGLCAALVLGVHWAGGSGTADEDEAAKPVETEKAPGLAVDAAMQARIGLKLAPVQALTTAGVAHGFARGLDAGPLASIESDIAAASAAARASAAEAARLAMLIAADQSASRQALDAARAQAAADAARLKLAEQRVTLEYGPGLAAMGDGARRALLAEITAGRAALVRIDLPQGNAGGLRLADGGTVRVIGPATLADPKLQSPGLLGIAHGQAARTLNNGRVADVTADATNLQSGVLVPADAVVRWHGGQWVYRRSGGGRFERVELVDPRPVEGGVFVASGLAAGQMIAVQGAGSLLALDRAADLAQESD